MTLRAGRLVLVEELRGAATVGECVRVTGRLREYDAAANTAILVSDSAASASSSSSDEAVVLVDTRDAAVSAPLQAGGLVQFLGDVASVADAVVVVRARIARPVDGANMELFRKALSVRRRVFGL